VATKVNNLGSVLKDLGDLAGARQCCERALKIDEAAYGADHPSVARDVNNLGSVLKELGDLAGARQYFERALAVFKRSVGKAHPSTQQVQANVKALDAVSATTAAADEEPTGNPLKEGNGAKPDKG